MKCQWALKLSLKRERERERESKFGYIYVKFSTSEHMTKKINAHLITIIKIIIILLKNNSTVN